MKFLYPLGLLGLIGIPVLILVYILKNKYTEQTIPSTYLWTLSEKFLKKRPVSKIAGIISLALQLSAVLVLSLALAHPVLVQKGQAYEYCFILDGSASMQMSSAGETRFARGKAEIATLINQASDGSVYTLVCVSDATAVVYEKTEDKKQALSMLNETDGSYASVGFTDALTTAQAYFNENTSLKTYLITDKTYSLHNNIEVINVSAHEENYAVSNVTCQVDHATGLQVNAEIVSYESDAALEVNAYIDDETQPFSTQTITVSKGEVAQFTAGFTTADDYACVRVEIVNSDALRMDNQAVLYNLEKTNSYRTLIVSDTPFFWQAVLTTVGSASVEVITPADYTEKFGYGLYIFHSFTPESMPTDGAVWFMNSKGSVAGAGFSVQGEINFEKSEVLSPATSSSSVVKTLTKNLQGDEISISAYVKYGLYKNFTTLYSYKGQPIIFTGENEYGNREVVFAFDVHNSNFALLPDFVVLMSNLWGYSFPDVVSSTLYECGKSMEINMLPGCDMAKIDAPSGKVSYLSRSGTSNAFLLNEVGVYAITMTVGQTTRTFYVYSALPSVESAVTIQEANCSLQGEKTENGFDGKFDQLIIIFACLLLIFGADWVVYCYDKYQLR